MEVALVSAFIFLLASNAAMILTCGALRITQQLWLRDNAAIPLGWLVVAVILPLAIGMTTSAIASVSAAWCVFHEHLSRCDWSLQKCFLPYAHWCAHLSGNKLIGTRIAAAISSAMKFASGALLSMLVIGRIAWHRVWKRVVKPPSQKLLSAASMLPELSSCKVRFAECDSDFCAAGLFGWLSPTCVISSDIANALTERELAAVIQHELIHKRRRDHVLRLLLRFLSFVLLSPPWLLWLRRRLEEAIENSACIEMASRQYANEFESALRKCAAMLHERGAPESALQALSCRIESLRASGRWQRQLQSRIWLGASLLCATLIALALLLAKPIFGTMHCFLEVVMCRAN